MNKSSTAAIRAYLGGSFDPVHQAHIDIAMQVYDALAPIATEQNRALQVSLLPNARSPFKAHSTEPKHRLAMLKLATQNTPLGINELELWQTPPVYTIDSVRALRQRYPDDSLIFIMGMDSVRSLANWKDGLQLTDYVHLWVFDRTHNDYSTTTPLKQTPKLATTSQILTARDIATLATELPDELQPQVVNSLTELLLINQPLADRPLKDKGKGRIYIDKRSVATISSTEIRKHFANQVYTSSEPTFSSNDLHKRLDSRIYQYIIAHRLYSAP